MDRQTEGHGQPGAVGTRMGCHRPARYSHAQISQRFCGEDEGLVPLMGELEHAGGGQALAGGATRHLSQPQAPIQPPPRRSPPILIQRRGLGFSLPSEMAPITPVTQCTSCSKRGLLYCNMGSYNPDPPHPRGDPAITAGTCRWWQPAGLIGTCPWDSILPSSASSEVQGETDPTHYFFFCSLVLSRS